MLINFTKKVPRHKRGRDVEEGKFLNPREKHNRIKSRNVYKNLLGVFLIGGNILDFLIGGTIHELLFTMDTIHVGTVHGGTIHEKLFLVL